MYIDPAATPSTCTVAPMIHITVPTPATINNGEMVNVTCQTGWLYSNSAGDNIKTYQCNSGSFTPAVMDCLGEIKYTWYCKM